ncbi:hypothetical protein LTR86_004545 [Recurvomyces mirabilis]|nr:hypothetical protein LTR86_004545 [Recurvomyces mirabilis]
MPAELTMRMYTSTGSSYFEGMYFGNSAALKTALQPLLNATGLSISSSTQTDFLSAFKHYSYTSNTDITTDPSQETFYSKSLMLKGLNASYLRQELRQLLVQYRPNQLSWLVAPLDIHGGNNSAVTNGDHSLSSYAHRDKLFMIQFYDRIYSGSCPSTGFSFLNNWVNVTVALLAASDWGIYINYADSQLDRSTATQEYYESNLARLQTLKATCDPAHLFYYPQSI